MYILLGIDDTDSPNNGVASLNNIGTASLALTLGQKLESLNLARLINISCHQLFQHPTIPHTDANIACCLLLDTDSQRIREIDLNARLILRNESSPKSNPGYALAVWNQFDQEVVTWGTASKISVQQRQNAITLARRCGIAIAGITGTGAGVIGALAAIGLRYDGNDGYIYWMPGLAELHGVYTQLEIAKKVHFESIESDLHKHPALDDRIQINGLIKPLLKEGRVVLPVHPAKRGSDFEWES